MPETNISLWIIQYLFSDQGRTQSLPQGVLTFRNFQKNLPYKAKGCNYDHTPTPSLPPSTKARRNIFSHIVGDSHQVRTVITVVLLFAKYSSKENSHQVVVSKER